MIFVVVLFVLSNCGHTGQKLSERQDNQNWMWEQSKIRTFLPHQLVVLGFDSSGSKQLVLRGVNHNRDVGFLTSPLSSIHHTLHQQRDNCETDLLGWSICWHLKRCSGPNWADRYHRLHSHPCRTVAYITLNVDWLLAVGCRPIVSSLKLVCGPKCN